jgi:hypothetical protein
MLAVLPNVIHVYGATHQQQWKGEPMHEPRPVAHVMFLDRHWFHVETPSVERAKWIGYRWEQYRRLWWVLALVAACVVVREIVPVPRLFGRDDD